MPQEKQILDIDGAGLPYDFEAEQGVLASILVDPDCLSDVITQLKEECFYIPNHKVIYRTLLDMNNDNIRVDFIVLLDRLKKEGVYDKAGGKAYITDLIQSEASSANVMTYVNIVRERYYARALIVASRQIITDATENTMDAGMLLEKAEQRIYEIREGRSIQGLEHIKTVIQNETFERLMKMNNPETRADYVGIPTGIGALDKMITGLNKSDLIILGARPGMGKTSFALNIVRNVAVNAGKKVAVFSLEMSRDQLAQRLLSSEAAIKSEKLRTGEL
ncbi:MAG: DnaB-like helicase C-terminal domain-containing protein, partial [Acutalibacteraceae bacterium]|nr:DnaB-like helicase C-terminal domain-containing protein [Acutalibacteraceae bacterium]